MINTEATTCETSPAQLDEMIKTLRQLQARHSARSSAELKYPESRGTPEEREYLDKSWRLMREQQAEVNALLSSWPRRQQEAVLLRLLPAGSEIQLELTEEWLKSLIIWRPARLLEAQRLKEAHMKQPSAFHLKQVAEEGDNYWLRLAQSYQGDV